MPELDFYFMQTVFSVGASATALASSVWLWISRFRGEQPNLFFEQTTPMSGEFVWPVQFAELYRTIDPDEDEGLACFWTDAVVINNSTMPNAVIEIDAWIRLIDGRWHPTLVSLQEDEKIPVNIPPHSTARLPLQLATKLPYDDSRSSNSERVEQVDEQISPTRELKIRIRGVKGTSFESILSQPMSIADSKFGSAKSKAA